MDKTSISFKKNRNCKYKLLKKKGTASISFLKNPGKSKSVSKEETASISVSKQQALAFSKSTNIQF